MQIRKAASEDVLGVERVYQSAFPAEEWQLVFEVAAGLLECEGESWIGEVSGQIVAHVSYSRVKVNGDDLGYILAPLAVRQEFQGRELGSELVRTTLQELKDAGESLFFVYGDPKYYGRFGFSSELAEAYEAPYALKHPFGWQALVAAENDFPTGKLSCVDALSRPELW